MLGKVNVRMKSRRHLFNLYGTSPPPTHSIAFAHDLPSTTPNRDLYLVAQISCSLHRDLATDVVGKKVLSPMRLDEEELSVGRWGGSEGGVDGGANSDSHTGDRVLEYDDSDGWTDKDW